MRLVSFIFTVVIIALITSLSIQFLAIQIHHSNKPQPSTALNLTPASIIENESTR